MGICPHPYQRVRNTNAKPSATGIRISFAARAKTLEAFGWGLGWGLGWDW